MKKTPKKQRISCIVLLIIFTVFVTMFANEQSAQAYSKKEWDVIKYTNQYRMEKGRSPLMLCFGMQKLSNIRKKEVAQYYSHTRPSGENCFSIIGKVSFYPTALGENIASGFKDSQKVVKAWIGSKGHRKNILNRSFTHIGAGYVNKGLYSTSWVQYFAGTASVSSMMVENTKKIKKYKVGTTIEKMNKRVVFNTSYGKSYMPLITAMCSGYQKNKTGIQTIKVTYKTTAGKKLTYKFKINCTK